MRLKLNLDRTFVVSDLHFHHHGLFKYDPTACELFDRTDTNRVKLVTQWWNEIVSEDDTVLVLGDVCFSATHLSDLIPLNGHKILVLGNHDNYPTEYYYANGFEGVYGCVEFNRVLFSHYPTHPCELNARYKANIHGHLHNETIDDPRYLNVSMERTNYRPMRLMDAFSILGV